MSLTEFLISWIQDTYTYYIAPYFDDEYNKTDKPIVIVDVDGVILNFTRGFQKWWNEEKGYDKKYQHVVPDNPVDWHFEYPGDRKVIFSKLKQFMDAKPMFELLDDTVSEALAQLRNHFHVIIVTAYPHEQSRIENLEMYNIRKGYEYDELYCCFRKDKAEVISAFGKPGKISFIVEDCPDHVSDLIKQGYTVYAPRRWNYLNSTFENYQKHHTSIKGLLMNYDSLIEVVGTEIELLQSSIDYQRA